MLSGRISEPTVDVRRTFVAGRRLLLLLRRMFDSGRLLEGLVSVEMVWYAHRCRRKPCPSPAVAFLEFHSQAGYFDLQYAPCNATACILLYPNYCFVNYRELARLRPVSPLATWFGLTPAFLQTAISAAAGPPPGGIPAGGIAGLALLAAACILVPILMCCLYSRWRKQSLAVQDTVVETYKYEEKYGFNPYTELDSKAPVVSRGTSANRIGVFGAEMLFGAEQVDKFPASL